jgi:hypothetical protein
MKIFFDTEFTGLHQNTTLISFGAITEEGQTFYAEFGDYDHHQINEWLNENVISKLRFHNKEGKGWCNCSTQNAGDVNSSTEVYGNAEFIKECLTYWLVQFDQVEIWSDCLAYDWVLFNNIFGTAFDIPENVYYIPFDICTLFKIKGIDPDISREDFAEVKDGKEKHNALFDALIIKKCYEKLINL